MISFSKARVELFLLAWPIVTQSVLTTSMVLIDSLMVAPLGDLAIGGMGVASAVIVLIFSIQLGVANGTLALLSQSFGADHNMALKRTFIFGIFTNLSISILIFGIIVAFSSGVIGIFTSSKELISMTLSYLSICIYTVPITAITLLLSFTFRSQGETIIPLKGFMLEVPINIVLNALLIYGIGVFPALGLKGAAISSLLARLFRLIYLGIQFRRLNNEILIQPFNIDRALLKKWVHYLRVVVPFILLSLNLTLGRVTYHVVFARQTLSAYAAYALILPWVSLGVTVANSLASASSIQLGRILGKGEFSYASKVATTSISTSLMVGFALALLLFNCQPLFQLVYSNLSLEVNMMLNLLLPLSALWILAKSFNLTVANGILRSGADSHFTLAVDLFSQWLVAVPLCVFLGLSLNWPLNWLYTVLLLEEGIKIIPLYIRMKERLWIRTLIV